MEIGRSIRETADTVLGWRTWIVTETTTGLRLGSVLHDLVWTPGEAALAVCRLHEDPFAEPLPPHPVPSLACNCGFHAARDPADALSYLRGRDDPHTLCRILGEVALWGHVVETESGWRASHAYPARLYVPAAALVEELAAYGAVISSAEWESGGATSSKAGSAGSPTSSWSAARMRSSPEVVSG
jgi:hypothetical protein